MIQNLFPTSVYQAPLARSTTTLNRDLKMECLKFAEIDEQGRAWSERNYAGGYTSYGSIANLHQISSTFEDLAKKLEKHKADFVRHLEMDVDPRELKLTRIWINIMPPGTQHSFHLHPLSVISGTYYVQTPPNCAALKFEDPRVAAFMAAPPRKAKARLENQLYPRFKPKAGHLILFESWLKHEVPPNTSQKERISVSFNYDWV